MKIFKKSFVFLIALCIIGLGTSISVLATTQETKKIKEIENYVQYIQEYNKELSVTNIKNIPATITLNENIPYNKLYQYVTNNNLEIVQLQARGIDANGDKVTFASKVSKGLNETDKILKAMAQDEEIEFIGYNAMYVLVNSEQLITTQADDLTFLIDTSSTLKENLTRLSEKTEIDYPHSLAWTIEELDLN